MVRSLLILILFLAALCGSGPALAADCEGDFASWLQRFKAVCFYREL